MFIVSSYLNHTMGCAHSKIENEETVLRCKERKQFMKEAVTARNAFAAAHFAYVMSLKNTGAALSDYAHGEISSSSAGAGDGAAVLLPSAAVSHYDATLPPPPPPPPNNLPLQRASSMPEISSVRRATAANLSETVIEEGEEGEVEDEAEENGLRHRTTRSSGGGGVFAAEAATRSDRTTAAPPLPRREESENGLDFFFMHVEDMAGPSLAEVDHEGSVKRLFLFFSFFSSLKLVSTARSKLIRLATSCGRPIGPVQLCGKDGK